MQLIVAFVGGKYPPNDYRSNDTEQQFDFGLSMFGGED